MDVIPVSRDNESEGCAADLSVRGTMSRHHSGRWVFAKVFIVVAWALRLQARVSLAEVSSETTYDSISIRWFRLRSRKVSPRTENHRPISNMASPEVRALFNRLLIFAKPQR